MPDGDDQKPHVSADEQAKIDAAVAEKIKSLGYDDHAKDVIARLNKEAQKNRESAEAAETAQKSLDARLKEFEKAEAARKADADKAAAEAADKAKAAEDAKKSVDQKIADLQSTFERELTKREQDAAAAQAKLLDEMKARDAQILMQAVISEATKQEVVDDSIVSLLDLKDIPMEHGVPDKAKIAELITEHKKAKPHLYKPPADPNAPKPPPKPGEPVRPVPGDTTDKVDWAKLSRDEFESRERDLRAALPRQV